MRLLRSSHSFVWGSLAALLYAGAANPERDLKASPTYSLAAFGQLDAGVTGAGATAILTNPDVGPALADPNLESTVIEPDVKLALADPDAKVNLPETPDACLISEECINRYLWSVYERTPKLDTVKKEDRIKVTIKKNGKSRTVTKTVASFVNEDFTWKDPQAAEKVGMPLAEYVIGGMDPGFKVRLYRLLRAMDDAGLAPGMTSGFRDDYRQSIASGNKAASDSSYHGGTRRGGYGHGLAADLVSVKGETRAERLISSDILWMWIDAHGKEFGIGRPYLDRDPPHVAPIDGKEWADKRGVTVKRAGLQK